MAAQPSIDQQHHDQQSQQQQQLMMEQQQQQQEQQQQKQQQIWSQQPPEQQYQQQQPQQQQAPPNSDEVRTIWIGGLQYWMDENYISCCFAHTGEVYIYISLFFKIVGFYMCFFLFVLFFRLFDLFLHHIFWNGFYLEPARNISVFQFLS